MKTMRLVHFYLGVFFAPLILFFAFYYLCLQFGESFADRLLLPPWLAMWLANIVLGSWGLYATLRACEVRLFRRVRRVSPPAAAEAA